jgi:hypothetical protein
MNESKSSEESLPVPPGEGAPDERAADPVSPAETRNVKDLTPEEQMALYEENLKETDWGHQPC